MKLNNEKLCKKKSLGSVSFLWFCLFYHLFVHFFTAFYLFPPSKTLLSWHCYQILCLDAVTIHALSICHQDMWRNPLGLSCVLNFCYFTIHFWHFSVYSSCFYPDVHCLTHTTHHYVSHWTCNHTWIASNNVIFCMSCYYHFHLFIPYVTCGVKMMSLCHGWDWQPPQTASHIHVRHIQSIWAHWYAVHWHMVAALHSYTHPTWLRILGAGSHVESKWCHYVMVEADSHPKSLPTSILDIHKVFEHIDTLSIGIQ